MNTKKNRTNPSQKQISAVRYLIGDFLEMKTRLSVCEREMLMDKIEAEAIESDSLQSQPAFWMDDRVLLVLNRAPSECWFYYAQSGKVEKVQMKGVISSFGQPVGVLE